MNSVSWLHLSDLHLRAGDQYDQSVVLSSLLEDIDSVLQEGSKSLDFVFITGDLAYSGKSEEYAVAGDFLTRLSEACRIPTSHIFCVPGNHDVDRSRLTPLLTQAARTLSNRELVSNVIGNHEEISLFNNRLAPYYDFVKSFFPWAEKLSTKELGFTENVVANDTTFSIVGLNSAWASGSSEDHGRILVGERQVREELAKTRGTDILIALLHHPLSHLVEFDASDVQGILDSRCDFVLHGHIHDFGAVRLTSPDSEVFYFSAGATYQGRRELLSYNIVELNRSRGTAQLFLRRYSDRYGGFWAPDAQMYRSGANGILGFQLPERLTHIAQKIDLDDVSERIESFVGKHQTQPVPAEPQPTVPSPPPALIEAIAKGTCVLFVGAGASIDAKLPTWYELVHDLIERVYESGTMLPHEQEEVKSLLENRDLLILATYCRERLGPLEFTEYLNSRLTDSGRSSRTHRLLANIPFRAAVTTNFDTFIESYHERARVVLPDMMEKLGAPGVETLLNNSNVFPVVKMHGSVEDSDSIVLTRKDFRNALFTKPKYRDFLRRLFTDSTLFFYGYSFNDPNVDFILQEIMAMYEGMTRPHYALLPELGEIARKYWMEDFNIRTITYPIWNGSHLAATAFLDKISAATSI